MLALVEAVGRLSSAIRLMDRRRSDGKSSLSDDADREFAWRSMMQIKELATRLEMMIEEARKERMGG